MPIVEESNSRRNNKARSPFKEVFQIFKTLKTAYNQDFTSATY